MENKERFKLIPLVGLILIKEDKILLLRRFQTGFEDGKYSFIAGHVDGNESMTEAMAREAKEEAGIIIDPGKLKHTLTMHRKHNGHETIQCYFKAEDWIGEPKNVEPDKCDDMQWFSIDKIPQNIVSWSDKAIECYQKGIHYYEFGWERK